MMSKSKLYMDYLDKFHAAQKEEEKEKKFKDKEIVVLDFERVIDFEQSIKERLKRLVRIDGYCGCGTKSYYISFYEDIGAIKEMLPKGVSAYRANCLFQKEISEDYLRKPTEQEMFVYKIHGLISLDDDYEDYEKKNEEKENEL